MSSNDYSIKVQKVRLITMYRVLTDAQTRIAIFSEDFVRKSNGEREILIRNISQAVIKNVHMSVRQFLDELKELESSCNSRQVPVQMHACSSRDLVINNLLSQICYFLGIFDISVPNPSDVTETLSALRTFFDCYYRAIEKAIEE